MLDIAPLTRLHDRRRFDCGVSELNHYLQNTARQHSAKGIARTFVLVNDQTPGIILGYYTLCACEVVTEKMPRKHAKKYPPRAPAAKLARLAVDKQQQGRGLGSFMMVDAFNKVLSVSRILGIIGFFVDAKDETAKKFYLRYGFIALPDDPFELYIPMETLQAAFADSPQSTIDK
jgi:GNAT superfamily N-acetyltransferase